MGGPSGGGGWFVDIAKRDFSELKINRPKKQAYLL